VALVFDSRPAATSRQMTFAEVPELEASARSDKAYFRGRITALSFPFRFLWNFSLAPSLFQ
jgi:hypothetical protein